MAFASGGGAAVVWQQRVVIPPLSESELKACEDERHGRTIFESGYYVAERRKKPPAEGAHLLWILWGYGDDKGSNVVQLSYISVPW